MLCMDCDLFQVSTGSIGCDGTYVKSMLESEITRIIPLYSSRVMVLSVILLVPFQSLGSISTSE